MSVPARLAFIAGAASAPFLFVWLTGAALSAPLTAFYCIAAGTLALAMSDE